MMSKSQSITGLIKQVAAQPSAVQSKRKPDLASVNTQSEDLNTNIGFAGVTRNAANDRFVGSGLHLELELSSGVLITLSIEKSVGGGPQNIHLQTDGELNPEDAKKLKQFLTGLSESVDALFSDKPTHPELFEFANMRGIKDIELSVQQDKGNIKQRFEFEKHTTQYGRKEVSGEWSRYDHLSGAQEQHNFALSKQPKDVAAAYGQMDYQWVVEQVKAGMGILGNSYTGDGSTQAQVTDFFVSALHSLFDQSRKGDALLQTLGATALNSKALIGQTIRALTDQVSSIQDMPGSAVQRGSGDGQKMNGLADFTADFASSRDHLGPMSSNGEYNLSMAISQVSRSFQGASEDDSTQTQFRRLILEYASQGETQSYEYNWRHDEAVINRFLNGALQQSYFKLSDLQQGLLNTTNGQREEVANFMKRKEYRAEDVNTPALKNGYIRPTTYTEQGRNVNYTV